MGIICWYFIFGFITHWGLNKLFEKYWANKFSQLEKDALQSVQGLIVISIFWPLIVISLIGSVIVSIPDLLYLAYRFLRKKLNLIFRRTE
jgi:Sec-independent protein secretion pathway component TatC